MKLSISSMVWAEPRRLERMIVNLISNASVHGGGDICVRTVGSEPVSSFV